MKFAIIILAFVAFVAAEEIEKKETPKEQEPDTLVPAASTLINKLRPQVQNTQPQQQPQPVQQQPLQPEASQQQPIYKPQGAPQQLPKPQAYKQPQEYASSQGGHYSHPQQYKPQQQAYKPQMQQYKPQPQAYKPQQTKYKQAEEDGPDGEAIESNAQEMEEIQRAKKSYESGPKCPKAVVVSCAPLLQKVKCKGGGHYKRSYNPYEQQYSPYMSPYETFENEAFEDEY